MKANQRAIKIGIHREKPRLWLEGAWLGMVGFQRGGRFTVTFKPGSITLRTVENGDDPAGSRTISGKTKNGRDVSVIDINANTIPFDGPAVVTVKASGHLVITPEAK